MTMYILSILTIDVHVSMWITKSISKYLLDRHKTDVIYKNIHTLIKKSYDR